MSERQTLKITGDEITQSFSVGEWADKYPPILTIDQAAELLQIPKATLYQWRSAGRLTGCVQRVGKHLRFLRDRLVLKLMSKGI
ncbi:Helix-turn-helix domain protein [Gimesia panareensis]|uniref:Helix-turn-helix domain protein n=1 Tax=Gimesia panareensis TaxID=2527978 RepID=A0A518FWE6_9PLAN|nr:helix-turn-helix domain-containing protein [Gimesia panareensis]QDV20641.1 Helix-turn-helix domain protein [Gimesia panareensis]